MARVDRSTAVAASEIIRTETSEGANTANRVGTNLKQLAESALWKPESGLGLNKALRCTVSDDGMAYSAGVEIEDYAVGIGDPAAPIPAGGGGLKLGYGYSCIAGSYDGGQAAWLTTAGDIGGTDVQFGGASAGYRYLYSRALTGHRFFVGTSGGTEALSVGAGYIGIGPVADQPTTGDLRIPLGGAVTIKSATGGGIDILVSVGDSGNTDLYYSSNSIRNSYCDAGVAHVFSVATDQEFKIGSGYVAVGSGSLPTTGNVRTEGAFSLTGYRSGVAAGASFLSWNNTGYSVWLGEDTNVTFTVLAAATGLLLRVGGAQIASVDSDGLTITSGKELDVTGVTVATSSGSHERLIRGVTALDSGADGAPVSIVSYAIPSAKAATIKIWVKGDSDVMQEVIYDSQWTIKVYRDGGGYSCIEHSTPVTPDSVADPAGSGIAVTYSITGTTLTVYKQNTSGTAMLFSGQLVIAEDDLLGSGSAW